MKKPFILVFEHEALHGVELDVETLRVMAYRKGDCTETPRYRIIVL